MASESIGTLGVDCWISWRYCFVNKGKIESTPVSTSYGTSMGESHTKGIVCVLEVEPSTDWDWNKDDEIWELS